MQKSLNLNEMNVLKNILYFEAQSMKGYIESLIEWASTLQILQLQITPLIVNHCISAYYKYPTIGSQALLLGVLRIYLSTLKKIKSNLYEENPTFNSGDSTYLIC